MAIRAFSAALVALAVAACAGPGKNPLARAEQPAGAGDATTPIIATDPFLPLD
jgi:hypothetical protein